MVFYLSGSKSAPILLPKMLGKKTILLLVWGKTTVSFCRSDHHFEGISFAVFLKKKLWLNLLN